jgi:Co/Zn/Cd efflux system component
VELSQRTLIGIYYAVVLALIVAGVVLWSTGHGTGDPYLSVGIAMALVPVAVKWLRDRFRRD